jgi:hypothetical protein
LQKDFSINLPDGGQFSAGEILFQDNEFARLEFFFSGILAIVLLAGAFRFLLFFFVLNVILFIFFVLGFGFFGFYSRLAFACWSLGSSRTASSTAFASNARLLLRRLKR